MILFYKNYVTDTDLYTKVFFSYLVAGIHWYLHFNKSIN